MATTSTTTTPTSVDRSLITLSSKHYVGGSTFRIDFNAIELKNTTISIESLAMYNSIFNITSNYNNNKFFITWIDGSTYNFTIPDSYMEYDDINSFIEQQCLLNNLYMTSNSGSDNIFFFKLATNKPRYKVQLDIYYVPTSANATTLGWSKPPGATWNLPSTNTTPQIQFNAGMCKLTGFAGSPLLPATPMNSNVTYLSNSIPKLLNVFTLLFTCNLVDNKMNSAHRGLLAQIPIKSGFASLLSIDKSTYTNLPVRSQTYTGIELKILDQDYTPIQLNDLDFSCVLLLETKS